MAREYKDYFSPVFLEDKEEEPEEEERFPTKEELLGLFRVISEEIDKYQSGRSKFTKYPVIFDQRTGPPPLFKMLELTRQRPTKETWEAFLAIVEQEMNPRVKDFFVEQFNKVKEQLNEPRTHLK